MSGARKAASYRSLWAAAALAVLALPRAAAAQQVIPTDLIVQGSECVGIDCSSSESFGFDTIRLKENNLRIHFDDTSTAAGFPSTDWRITVNDSPSGGANRFSIDDATAATIPFNIFGGAPTNSVVISSAGRLGLRTSTPVLDIHAATGNTPAMRLEQNSSGGFTAQTWDIAGNEANFFVRDLTAGSRLPFRIRPGAPTSSLDIAASGNVGIGTGGPLAQLHVHGTAGTTKALIQEASTTAGPREILELRNNGITALIFNDTSVSQRWSNATNGPNFILNEQTNAGIEFSLTNTGNLTIAGMLTQNSDRTTKTDMAMVNHSDVLERLDRVPIMTWRKQGEQAVHLGPMAQDFSAAFGLGEDDRHIAPLDAAGVSLAAVQALRGQLQQRDARIVRLEEESVALARRLAELEARLLAAQP